MTRTASFVDPDGNEWAVEQVSAHGVGARAEGDAVPQVSAATIRFSRGDKERWHRNAPLDWNRPAELLDLFRESVEIS